MTPPLCLLSLPAAPLSWSGDSHSCPAVPPFLTHKLMHMTGRLLQVTKFGVFVAQLW